MSTILSYRLWDPRYALICAILCFAVMETACGPVGRNQKERSSRNSEARMEPLMVSLDSVPDNSYDKLSSKNTHGVVKNANAILEIELQNLNAKRIQASKDFKVNQQMVEIYKQQMFILGQRMVQKHSDVDRTRAVVAELDQLIHRLKSRMNTNVWIGNVRDQNNIIEKVTKNADSFSEEILEMESSTEGTSPAEPIDPPVEEPPVYSTQEGTPQPHNAPWKPMLGLVFLVGALWAFNLLPVMSDKCTTLQGLEGTAASLANWSDSLSDWYKRSQPAATSQGVRSEKTDKTIMDIYEHISRLSGRFVATDDRFARWEKKMTKLEKQHEDESEKRKAAELRMTAFDQTIDKAVSSILASVALSSAKTQDKTVPSVCSTSSSPIFKQKQYATYSVPGKQDSDSDSLSEAETMAGEVEACGVADSESQWILVTRKKKRDPTGSSGCQRRG
mmetsp:Transcript_11254/g.24163  ORF Transcript_11254/g.24163 Transcript_11254/m.24163 type:complete len:447 (-) Transcript_11254:12-1352(-)